MKKGQKMMNDVDKFPGLPSGPVIILKVGDTVIHKFMDEGVVTSTFVGGAYVIFGDRKYKACSSEDLYLKKGV